MFRLDRENLGNPCAICKHNRNFTNNTMFGSHVKCNNTIEPTWKKVGEHDIRTVCSSFELDIGKLETAVYNKYAIALSRTTCGTFNEDGTIKTSVSPAWIMHYILWQAYRDQQFCDALELKFNRRTLKEIMNFGRERVDSIIHTNSKTPIKNQAVLCGIIFLKINFGSDYATAMLNSSNFEGAVDKMNEIQEAFGMEPDDWDPKYL